MIRVRSASKAFGKVRALDDVTLDVAPGNRVAFVGTNGSGKTTLLRAIAGLLRIDGTVTIDGVDVAKRPEIALANVAYVPQIAPPLEAPVSELLRAFATIRQKSETDITTRARRLGLDVDAVRKTRFRDLSGGTKQKLLAAMALATESPILLCDEPTANLDAASRAAFFAEVNARPENSIVVLCSHRKDEVRHLVERIIEMKDGKIACDAPLEAALSEFRNGHGALAADGAPR